MDKENLIKPAVENMKKKANFAKNVGGLRKGK